MKSLRTLCRNPAYLAAIAILALGIAMSVAMFSLVDAVLLRPLPFPQPGFDSGDLENRSASRRAVR